MPSKDVHLAKAEHNEKLADTLLKTDYLDWAVTVLFYSALHYVDAVLDVYGSQPDSHDKRDTAIRKNATLRRIFPEYKALYVMSRNARYYGTPIRPEDIQVLKPQFDSLQAYIRQYFHIT